MLPQDNFSLSFFLGLVETQAIYNYLYQMYKYVVNFIAC